MGLLDGLRGQPAWQHADATIRLAGVREIPDEQQQLLASIALEDTDSRVRRAAVGRLTDAALLARVAARDTNEGVRDDALRQLLDLALARHNQTDESASLAALAALTDQKHVVGVARGSAFEAVRSAAVARLGDAKALGSVARQAEHETTRLDALARIDDPAEILAVLLKTEFKDVALSALERISDTQALRVAAVRARNKVAARRARSRLRAIEAPGRPNDEQRPRLAGLCETVEALGRLENSNEIAERLAAAEDQWLELDAQADDALVTRFAAGCENARQRLAQCRIEETERHRRDQEQAAVLAARTNLCERIEALGAESVPDGLDAARAEWTALPTPVDPDDTRLHEVQTRFERACKASEQRHENWKRARDVRARLEQLTREAEQAVEIADLAEARKRWRAVLNERARIGADNASAADLTARLGNAETRFAAREAEARETCMRQREKRLNELRQLCERLETLAGSNGLTLRQAEQGLREARIAGDALGSLPSKRDAEQMTERLKTIQHALGAKVRELREIEEWQRWANVGVQEQLCARVEALREVEDIAELARQLREIEDQWKQVSSVPKERAQALWTRYKAAHDENRARAETFFRRQAEERAGNLKTKQALCAQVEALAESTDWIRTAETVKGLQAQWKTIGQVPVGHEKAVWARFRTACDRFFTRRHEDLARRKADWASNLALKEALCVRVEALAESADWEKTAAEIRQLQAEWKTIGPVKKNKSEAIWQRFRAACDRFFTRYAQRGDIEIAARLTDAQSICAEIESLASAGAVSGDRGESSNRPPDLLFAQAEAAWHRWRSIDKSGALPRMQAASLRAQFTTALGRLVEAHPKTFRDTVLDPDANCRRMENLCARVEQAVSGGGTAAGHTASPTVRLAAMLKEALAANTIGGKVDEEARRRAAAEEVRKAQAAWQSIGPVAPDIARSLTPRFQKACRQFFEGKDQRRGGNETAARAQHPARGARS